VKFDAPPINEVVMAIFHEPIHEMRVQHIGVYWQLIRKKFPLCQQQSPILSPNDPQSSALLAVMPDEIFPLPRFWFSGKDDPNLIQIQRDAFILNWRRGTNTAYPHYEQVEQDFWEHFDTYRRFVEESMYHKIDLITRCELTYINVIERNTYFSAPADIGNIVPFLKGFCDLHTDKQQFLGLNSGATYRISDNIHIDLTTKLGSRADTKEQILLLEFKVHGVPRKLTEDSAREWYKVAHDIVYSNFLSNTDERVQKEVWKRQ
jgi:uncharacterized protein (TIGR04255 family)